MATIAVLGASGVTGRLATAELVRRGHHPIVAAPDASRLAARLQAEGVAREAVEIRTADAEREDTLDALLATADLVLNLAGPYEQRGAPVVEAALRAGAHYVDAALEPAHATWVHRQDGRAATAGCVVVPAAGFPNGVLDLLAGAALGAVTDPEEVHLASTFPSRGWLRAGAGPTTRAVLSRMLERPVTVRSHGEEVHEPLGEARRLAWFPRPVGLAHAAGVPGTGHLSVPRHVGGVATVREYLARSGWQAELLQLAGNATRFGPPRRWLSRVVVGTQVEPAPSRRERVRWACVAETRGAEGVARAWANGLDPAATAAAGLVVVAEAVLARPVVPGVRVPGELAAPGALLDELSAGREMRWSVLRPG